MSHPDTLVSTNGSDPPEGREGSDTDSKQQENVCRHCIPNEFHQEITEEESEQENGPQVLDRKDIVSPSPQPGHEELELQCNPKEDVEFQQWSDGSSYRGNLTMNMKRGVGEFRWANGESYIGEFYKDHHHGKGVYSWPDGSKFTGSFYLSRKEGYGTMTFPDGKTYQGLYKSDIRYGPGFETYNDGCQDVGIWKGQHLFRLCNVLPGSISILSFPQFCDPQQSHKGYVSKDPDSITIEEKGKADDPFFFRYKFLLLEDSVILPEKIYSYCSDTDHLPITPTQYLEFDQHFFRLKDQQEISNDVTSDNVQPNNGMRKIHLHVNTQRHSPEHLKWGMNSILNGDRYTFGPTGPREQAAEQLIVVAGLGDYDAISTILRHDLAHVDVSDKCGLTGLQAAAVNGHNNVINLLLDNGADINKSNDEGLSALSLCLMLYSSKPFWPNVAERNLPLIKEESSDFTSGISEREGSAGHEKDVKHYDKCPTSSETCLDIPPSQNGPGPEELDFTSDPCKDTNLRSTINLLLLRGADPDTCSVPTHPLFFAVRAADADTVQLLLECGASTDIRLLTPDSSLTPLHIAVALPVAEGTRITEILLYAASNPNACAEDEDYVYIPDRGESPGAVQGFPMKGCLDSGLPLYNYYEKSPHIPEEGGRTPLHVACEREDNFKLAKDTISLLLAHNAKVNTLWSGHSPLSLAIASGNDMAVKELLANGADPNLALSRGVGSALCAAVNTTYEKQRTLPARIALVDRLIKAGASILMPILIGEGTRTALGTATDYAYYKYFQDKKIAHTPYHALLSKEKDIFNARKQLLEHLGELTREAVKAKEAEWAKDGIVRSSATHRDPERKVNTRDTLGERLMYVPKKTFFKYCYQCGRSVGVKLTPCLRCYSIYTCSKQCKKRSWTKLHKDECLQLSGKLSSKMTPSRSKRSSPTKSVHADRESSSHGHRPSTAGESVPATTENYSFN
ncbi:PREDICTED: ankyrin repeat and MYND domain-containing protein 1 [Nanorana parkeri]|uniref:ankyrin repeat and MYND domain-containing protein 1 n=1 Tax=Nanorana parkeri TaxID=125878 RepID=UPI0008549A52|nr:PREDICTED: ankyrin repeat and MYND domain-containing protein 1 [Nanorana parkeri]